MKQEVLDTPESKFDVNEKVLWNNRPDAKNKKWIDATISDKSWDADKEEWLYHLESKEYFGKPYFILFAKESQIKKGES